MQIISGAQDYQVVNEQFILGEGAGPFNQLMGGELCITVSVFDDSILEDTQNFSIHLSSSDSCVLINVTHTTVCILDEDSRFNSSFYG